MKLCMQICLWGKYGTCGSAYAVELQVSSALTNISNGEGQWELNIDNIWRARCSLPVTYAQDYSGLGLHKLNYSYGLLPPA